MGQVGLFTGMNLGEFFFDIFGFPAVYILSVLFFAGSIIVLSMMPKAEEMPKTKNNKSEGIPESMPRLSDFKEIITRRELFPVFYWIILLGFGFGFMVSFIPKIAIDAGLERVRPFYIAYPLTVLCIRSTVSSFYLDEPLSRFVSWKNVCAFSALSQRGLVCRCKYWRRPYRDIALFCPLCICCLYSNRITAVCVYFLS
ncbi:MAG: MFS transporter [Spirochaetia bacterium]